jgi:hypothetical protein
MQNTARFAKRAVCSGFDVGLSDDRGRAGACDTASPYGRGAISNGNADACDPSDDHHQSQ